MASAQQWVTTGIRLVPTIISAVHAVESLLTAKSGKEKQDAAVEAVQAAVEVTEASIGKDFLHNGKIDGATRQFIDAYVNLQNAIAELSDARGRSVPPVRVEQPMVPQPVPADGHV